jgi:aspartyl protease family protein
MRIIPTIIISSFVLLSGCSGCSKSGSKKRISGSTNPPNSRREERPIYGKKTIVKMEKINGVFQIPVEVNGVKMYFIFDTGASIISISETEANFLWKQGKLTTDDIKGTANFSDANGDISEGTIIILTTVKIGDRILKNVEASVVHNLNAPLLFGQSALGKFGKIFIDNNQEEITFE